jgi:hypothetical protein
MNCIRPIHQKCAQTQRNARLPITSSNLENFQKLAVAGTFGATGDQKRDDKLQTVVWALLTRSSKLLDDRGTRSRARFAAALGCRSILPHERVFVGGCRPRVTLVSLVIWTGLLGTHIETTFAPRFASLAPNWKPAALDGWIVVSPNGSFSKRRIEEPGAANLTGR